ncbi:MAG: DHH family phosphoesterase [Candidatus Diapherotrites archaeon]
MGLLLIPKKFKEFISELKKEDNIGIYFDGDPDGLTAGAIIFRALKKMNLTPKLIFTQGKGNPFLSKETADFLKKNKINKFICVDISLDQQPEGIKECEKTAEKILILDHHKRYNDVDSDKTVMFKSGELSELDGAAYPSAKFSFDLFSEFTDLNGESWISATGIIGDNGLRHWKEFIEEVYEKHKTNFSKLNKLQELISAVEVSNAQKLNELVIEFINAKKPEDILNSRFAGLIKELEKEMNKLMEKFQKEKEVFEELELVFFEFESSKRIKSPLANMVSNEFYPNKTVFIFQVTGEKVLISARRQDYKVKVNDLIEESIKGFDNASGGGHIPAAAGKIMLNDLKEFKERIKKKLKHKYI